MTDTDPIDPSQRPVRTFVVRAGRMGSGQTRALQTLAPLFVLATPRGQPLDLTAAFGRTAPTVVEIGFGMGHATAAFAAKHPHINVLGMEVHPPGVGALLQLIDAQKLSNLRIVQDDAVDVLQRLVAPRSLAGLHVFFPDPWHKKRHHKRRLVQPQTAQLLAQRLAPGGYLHLATDWQPYAQQMLAVLDAELLLQNQAYAHSTDTRSGDATSHRKLDDADTSTSAGDSPNAEVEHGYVPRPASRPITKFERRGLALGHGVWDLMYTRRA
jgi:tRNA (guanine-N7-)-methyltransferase